MVLEEPDEYSEADSKALSRVDAGEETPGDWEIFEAFYSNVTTTREPQIVELRMRLAELTTPVLVLTGGQNRAFEVMANATASLFPNATRVVLPTRDGRPWQDNPGAFRETVENFLST
jgi:pimeloyl-ACP methyl ester carboxylesterase